MFDFSAEVGLSYRGLCFLFESVFFVYKLLQMRNSRCLCVLLACSVARLLSLCELSYL